MATISTPFVLAARERLDAAGRAEQVIDGVLVELILGQRGLAGEQLEILRRYEG